MISKNDINTQTKMKKKVDGESLANTVGNHLFLEPAAEYESYRRNAN